MLGGRSPQSFTDLVQALGWPKSTVHRMLATLMEHGYIEKTTGAPTYRVGLKLWGLGLRALGEHDLPSVARPYLRNLVALSQESVNLAILLGDPTSVMYVDKVDGPKMVQVNSPVGLVVPSWCTATGRAILAHRKDAWDRVLAGPLEKLTPNTVTDPRQLRTIFGRVANDGYAVARAERGLEHGGVASGIRDYSGEVIASCGVALPAFRMNRALVDRCIPLVVSTAQAISTALGYQSNGDRPARSSTR